MANGVHALHKWHMASTPSINGIWHPPALHKWHEASTPSRNWQVASTNGKWRPQMANGVRDLQKWQMASTTPLKNGISRPPPSQKRQIASVHDFCSCITMFRSALRGIVPSLHVASVTMFSACTTQYCMPKRSGGCGGGGGGGSSSNSSTTTTTGASIAGAVG